MDVFVIFGAAALADGKPSGALRRRVEGALGASGKSRDPLFLVTGGAGPNGVTEAAVMRNLLESEGVAPDRIVEDAASKDTLTSVVRCASIIQSRGGISSVIVCSDRYHIPRCRWLFHLLGVGASAGEMPSGLRANGLPRWAYYYLREAAAIAVDTAIVLLGRRQAKRRLG